MRALIVYICDVFAVCSRMLPITSENNLFCAIYIILSLTPIVVFPAGKISLLKGPM